MTQHPATPVAKTPPAPSPGDRAKVFVSYSRKDIAFAQTLVAELDARGFDAFLDKTDIAPGEPWQERLAGLIAACDTVVFTISPDSVASQICGWELEESARLGKRVLPMVVRRIADADAPPVLGRLNWILCTDSDDKNAALGALEQALRTDLPWVREHTRLGELARRWEAQGRSTAAALRGADLEVAERWLDRRPSDANSPTELHQDYIRASRRGATIRQRFWVVGAAAVAIVALVLAGWAEINRRDAQAQRDAADAARRVAVQREIEATRNQSAALAALSGIALAALSDVALAASPTRAMKLALAAWPRRAHDKTPKLGVTLMAISSAMVQSHERAILRSGDAGIDMAAFSSDGSRLVTTSADHKSAQIWEMTAGKVSSGKLLTLRLGGDSKSLTAALSPDGRRVLTVFADSRFARLWDATTGSEIATLNGPDEKLDADRPFLHTPSTFAAAFSPDGMRIVTTGAVDGAKTACLWDAVTGARIAILRGHDDEVPSAVFSPDGSRLATVSYDKTAKIWDARSGNEIATLSGHDSEINNTAFSLDGTRVVTASSDTTARVWNASDGKQVAVLRGHDNSLTQAIFSRDGARVYTASEDGTVRAWDAARGAQLFLLRDQNNSPASIALSRDGTRIITIAGNEAIRLWDVTTGATIASLREPRGKYASVAPAVSAAFSMDGMRIVVTASDKTARIFDAATGREIAALAGHAGDIVNAAFSPDGMRVVTVAADKTARLWDDTTAMPIAVLRGHNNVVSSAAFSADGRQVVTASDDSTARTWDAATGGPLVVLKGHESAVHSAFFMAAGNVIVTISSDSTARIWNAGSGKMMHVLRSANWLAVSPNGTRMVSAPEAPRPGYGEPPVAAERVATLWNPLTEEKYRLPQDGWVLASFFSPDSSRVLTTTYNAARLWDATTGKLLLTLGAKRKVRYAAFSPDGNRIATTSDRVVHLWDATTGIGLGTLDGHEDAVLGIAYSADGMRLVTASLDKTARVWDLATGKQIAVLRGHMDAVASANFSPDGNRVVTASRDNTARIWDISRLRQGNLFQLACASLPDRDLTGIARDYGLSNLPPICEADPPLPDHPPR